MPGELDQAIRDYLQRRKEEHERKPGSIDDVHRIEGHILHTSCAC